jgi:glycosyltransferase involved in cell wall biosynthesis
VEWWDRGFTMYNGTGFEDLAFKGKEFQTYKLGLCLWTSRQINYTQNGDFRRRELAGLEEDMWRMQSRPLGGFYTGYDKGFNPLNSSTNTETTCLCLMPYTVPQPIQAPTLPGLMLTLVIISARAGYKAGALNKGLKTAKGDYIVIADADTRMPKSFLRETLGCFSADDRLAFVQARCEYTDRWHNWVTESNAIERDIHHLVEQPAKDRYSLLPNFSGKAGIWRRDILEKYGWDENVLTEDIELSYRVQIDGWKSRYLSNPVCLIEIPPTLGALRTQQRRWTAGFAQSLRKPWKPLLRSPELTLGQKLETLIYLSSPLTHLAIPAAIILWILAAILEPATTLQLWLGSSAFSVFMFLISVAPNLSIIMGVLLSGDRRIRKLLGIPLMITLGSASLMANAKGALEGLFRDNLVFRRTVKYGKNLDLAQKRGITPSLSFALRQNYLELIGGILVAAAGAHLVFQGQLTSIIPLSYIAFSWWIGAFHA